MRISLRSRADVRAHSFCTFAAASSAATASSLLAEERVASTSPVAGLHTSNDSPLDASRHCPPINSPVGRESSSVVVFTEPLVSAMIMPSLFVVLSCVLVLLQLVVRPASSIGNAIPPSHLQCTRRRPPVRGHCAMRIVVLALGRINAQQDEELSSPQRIV